MSYEECEARSKRFFNNSEEFVPENLPEVADPGGPPCPICEMSLDHADLASGELGWACFVCGIEWCKLGCHGQRYEDWEGWES